MLAVCAALAIAGCGPGVERAARRAASAGACSETRYASEQPPSAMLVLLDRSSSMSDADKWSVVSQAIVDAFDQDVFDALHLGLYSAPSGDVAGPSCIFGLPVPCQAPSLPQVALAEAGANKSTANLGVRSDVAEWLTLNGPDLGTGDGMPLYAAINAAIASLQAAPVAGHRILFVLTDGSINCGQLGSRPGFGDCNGCDHEWEDPLNLVTRLTSANQDPSAPVETFFVGLPGADSFDASACNAPPYHMRLALSAMAYAGAPAFAPSCDGTTFTQQGADPTASCHTDLTQSNFDAQAVSTAISTARSEVLGCTFPRPVQAVDLGSVNVHATIDGASFDLGRRPNTLDPCTGYECWDYDADDDIELIGLACDRVKAASSATVEIGVGCPTLVPEPGGPLGGVAALAALALRARPRRRTVSCSPR